MELALYCPEYGYYEREKDNIGRAGDFFTSVSVGPLFGRLLAMKCAAWVDAMLAGSAHKFAIVEAGANKGHMAWDLVTWFKEVRPDLFGKMAYVIIEPSLRRRQWQRKTLANLLVSNTGVVEWISSIDDFADVYGIILSNELLDAFPVRRLKWDSARATWAEMGVGIQNGEFVWKVFSDIAQPSSPVAAEITAHLEHGFIYDTSSVATEWWRSAAKKLKRGYLVTFDYGLTTEDAFLPHRREGTLRSYRNHQASNDVLACPGEQDITAHVNFTDLRSAGENAGLSTEFFGPQSTFLTKTLASASMNGADPLLSPTEVRQFQTLTHPEHLGHKFHVLVQGRR